jgi:hypothetical protein
LAYFAFANIPFDAFDWGIRNNVFLGLKGKIDSVGKSNIWDKIGFLAIFDPYDYYSFITDCKNLVVMSDYGVSLDVDGCTFDGTAYLETLYTPPDYPVPNINNADVCVSWNNPYQTIAPSGSPAAIYGVRGGAGDYFSTKVINTGFGFRGEYSTFSVNTADTNPDGFLGRWCFARRGTDSGLIGELQMNGAVYTKPQSPTSDFNSNPIYLGGINDSGSMTQGIKSYTLNWFCISQELTYDELGQASIVMSNWNDNFGRTSL